jgi:tetratricopeptide (TPR) repeat protein
MARHPAFPHAHIALGLLLKNSGRSEEAVACAREALALWPDDAVVLRESVRTLRDLNREAEAEAVCKAFIEANPQSSTGLLVYVDLLRESGNRSQAAMLSERAVAIDPEDILARLALAGEYAHAGRLVDASAIYDRIVAAEPQNCWAWFGKGQLARRQGFRREALAFFQKAATCTPTTDWAAVELAKEYSDERLFREAEAALAPLGAASGELDADLQKGRIARLEGDFAKAREIFSRRVEKAPLNARIMLEFATELFRCGNVDRAVAMLKDAAVLEPRNSEALLALGNFAQSTGELAIAERIFRKAATLDPSCWWPLLSLARCLAAFGRIDESIRLIREVDERFGRLPEACQVEGAIFKEGGDYHEADRIFAEGVAAFPHNIELWLQHVLMRIMLGDFAVAEIMLRSPPQCSHTEQARVLVAKGLLAETRWDIGAAYHHFVAALKFNDADSWVHHCAANAALLQIDVAAVEKHLKGHLRTNVLHGAAVGRRNISQTHVGQLLDEVRIDRAAFDRLAENLHAPASNAIASVVGEYPDYTPAAIALLVALRRERKLTTLNDAWRERRAVNSIPRSIVQFWSDGQPPSDLAEYCDSWSRLNPDFSYRLFSKADARAFIADHSAAMVLTAFDRALSPATMADLFRLAYLFVHGGFYADADDRCLAALMTLMPPDRNLIVYQEEFGSIGNNIIGAAPGHPVIGAALEEAALAIMRGDNDLVWLSTGPGLLTRCFARHLAQQSSFEVVLRQTLVLERHELYRVAALHCQAQYKHSHRHWSRSAFFTKQSNRREQADFFDWFGPDSHDLGDEASPI